VRIEPDAGAADDAATADANPTTIPSAAHEFLSTAVAADWTAVSVAPVSPRARQSTVISLPAPTEPGALISTTPALSRVSSSSTPSSRAPRLLIRSNITKEIGRSTLYHEPLLTAPCAHRFRIVERMRAWVDGSSRAREAVFYVLTILFGFLFITAGPWISRPLPRSLIYTDITILSIGCVLFLSRIDWPLLRHLFRTFEFGFVACLCMGSLLVSVYQGLVDASRYVGGADNAQLYDVAAIQQATTGLLTFAMITVDALVVSPRVKMSTIFCWFLLAIAEVAAQTGVLVPLPAHTQQLRVCMRTECFSLLTLRVQLKLTIAIFAVKYFYLLWRQPHTLAVIRASVSYEVEDRESAPSSQSSASISPSRVEV
jgi:hypothetical protein